MTIIQNRYLLVLALLASLPPAMRGQEAPTTAAAQLDPRPKVALIGFEADADIDPRDKWIPDAFQELLTHRLRRVPGLIAIPTTRAYQGRRELQGPETEAPQWSRVTQALGATIIMSGTAGGPPSKARLELTLRPLDGTSGQPRKHALPRGRFFDVLDRATEWLLDQFDQTDISPELRRQLLTPASDSISAIEYYARALAAARDGDFNEAHRLAREAIGSDKNFRAAQALLAQIELRAGAFRMAGPRLRILAELARQHDDALDQIDAELKQALLLHVEGSFDAAMMRAQTALRLALEANDPHAQIEAIELIVDLHLTREPTTDASITAEQKLERVQEAVRAAIQSQELLIELLRTLPDRIAALAATNKLALLHERLGEHQAALEIHRRSLAIAKELGSQRHQATAWLFIGQCYRAMEQWQPAADALKQCLGLARDDAKAQVRLVLGGIYLESNAADQALEQLELACKAIKGTDDLLNQLSCLRQLAQAQKEIGRTVDAVKTLQEAIDIAHVLELNEEQQLRQRLERWKAE